MLHPVRSVIEELYGAGRCARLHVNASFDGVVCPDFVREKWRERLIIDLDSSYPLDLVFGDEGVAADLSFGGYVTRCSFPYKAIYVVADRSTGQGVVLDQNMPDSIRRARRKATPEQAKAEPSPAAGPAPAPAPAPVPAAAESHTEEPLAAETSGEHDTSRTTDDKVQERRAAFRIIDGGN